MFKEFQRLREEMMAKSKTPKRELFPVWSTEQEEGVDRYSSLPTPDIMKSGALFGIPLRSALTNETISDDTLQRYINAAISEVEHEMDLYIQPVTFEERYDYNKEMFIHSYAYLKLNHPNVLQVEKMELTFSNDEDTKIVDFPREFIHVMPQEGVLQLVPAYGTSFSGFLLSAFSGVQFHALRTMGVTDFPGGIRVKYTCGFEEDKVPAAITALIESIAAYRILSAMGPVIFPVNSIGVSIDGVSQSTGTSGPQFLQSRLKDLERIIDEQKRAVKGYYQRGLLVDWI